MIKQVGKVSQVRSGKSFDDTLYSETKNVNIFRIKKI